ncbi:MAG TPA: hypothetical protein VF516_35450 [Kofleriaceae bacterium]
MSFRTISLGLLAALALGCGGDPPRSDDPQTAKEKQRREAAAAGETSSAGGKWGGWRYTGDREECFFVVGRKCFKTEAAACAAARCGSRKCQTTGGGPAAVACAK